MFIYEKKLQYPVNIKNTNPKLASLIISQYGGPYIIELLKLSKSRSPRLLLNFKKRYFYAAKIGPTSALAGDFLHDLPFSPHTKPG